MVNRIAKSKVGIVVCLLLSAGLTYTFPFYSNQNQYLFFVVQKTNRRLLADPLSSTADPYPIFTSIANAIFNLGSYRGLQVAAFICTFFAIFGIYTFACLINPSRSRVVPIVSTIMVGSSLVALPHIERISFFAGLGTQAVINKPGFFQPSQAGSLLFIAFPLLFHALKIKAPIRSSTFLAPVSLMVLASILHPTYLIACSIAVGAALVADLFSGLGLIRIKQYLLIFASALVASVATNPSLFSSFGGGVVSDSDGQSQALYRFAFERIPHHTLWSHWPLTTELRLIGLTVIGIWAISRLPNGKWLATWFGSVFTVSMTCVFIVYVTKLSWLALLFPWRISVIFIPLICVATAVVISVWLRDVLIKIVGPTKIVLPMAIFVSLVIAIFGTSQTLQSKSPIVTDPATQLVDSAMPIGLGLIPLENENLRLNAGYPIYVDRKSPPYKGKDLVNWWTRIDQVQAFEINPELFCTADWARNISWIVRNENQQQASCTNNWPRVTGKDGWQLIQRPIRQAD